MATLNDNIIQSWDGLAGSEVQSHIKDQFQSDINEINKAIQNISFTTTGDGKTVNWNYTKVGSNTPINGTPFTIIPQSSYKVVLDSLSGESYVTPGSGATIQLTYHIENEHTVKVALSNAKAFIKVTNGNNVKPILEYKLDKSLASGSKLQTIVIPEDYLSIGVNNIDVTLELSIGGGLAEFLDQSDTELKICSFNFSFDSTITGLTDGYHTVIPSTQFSFGMDFNFKDGSRNLITGETYKNIINASNITVNIYKNDRTISKSFTGVSSTSGLTMYSIQGSNLSTPSQVFYVQAVLTFKDGIKVYSNVNKYMLFCQSNGTEDYSITQTYFIYKIKEFANYNNDSIIAIKNTQTATQYDTLDIELYAYIPTETTFTYSLNDKPILENISKPAGLQELTWTDLTLNSSGSNIVKIQDASKQYFELTLNTKSIGNNLVVPTDNLVLSLSSNGKNNTGEKQDWTYDNYSTQFSNIFDWESNGWINGSLVVNNGASAIINCKACNKIGAKTVSIRFKTSNENTQEKLISCLQDNTDGFEIFPQKAVIYRGGVPRTTEFTSENSEKEITFVWYDEKYNNISQIYVNGTSQMILNKSQSVACPANISIYANDTTLYLYDINVYNRSLTFSEIQALYKSHSTENLTEYIKQNSIFGEQVELGYNGDKVTISSLPVGSRYLLINAHPDGYNKPWEAINQLPKTKKVNNKEKETKSWGLLAGPTYYITKVEKNEDPSPNNFYADRITLSGQGTSSMAYPIKNFRIYFNKGITSAADTGNSEGFGDAYVITKGDTTYEEGSYGKTGVLVVGSSIVDTHSTPQVGNATKYRISQESIPANEFCLKADYAESSGVHNTGFAKMANYVMENSGNIMSTIKEANSKLPQNTYTNDYKVRSTIDGTPVYLFFADKEGNITYHGKYNFNNEKASPDVYGFVDIKDTSIKQDYFNNSGIADHAEILKTYFNDSTGYDDTHDKFNLQSSKVNPTECWEFSTNDAKQIANYNTFKKNPNDVIAVYAQMGAFTYPYSIEPGYPFYNHPVYGNMDPFTAKTKSGDIAWFATEQAWEFRYPDGTGEDNYSSGEAQPLLLKSLYKWVHKNNVYLWSNVSDKNEHANTFAENLHLYFNVNYLLKYYMMTKLFVCADQRVKNCMLAFYYDPKASINAGNTPGTQGSPMGKMRGYYIFYDNDTILGVNNTGSLTTNWDADETHDIFQGIDGNDVCYHGIWGNLEYCYKLYINNQVPSDYPAIGELGKLFEDAYQEIRSTLSDSKINQYLSSDLPDAASNIDEDVKYFWMSKLNPGAASDFINGTDSEGKQWADFDSESLDQYQGDRKYHRERFISKRLKWFDSMYYGTSATTYKIGYKPTGTTDIFTDGATRLTPEFNKWRFYVTEGEGYTAPTGTKLLNKGEEGVLYIKNMINSYPAEVQGLYGCAKMDLSGWYGNTTDLTDTGITGTLVYLKEFILGPTSETNKLLINSQKLANFVGINTPNLTKLTLQNITNVNNEKFATIALTKLTKLTNITINNVNVDVLLPSGSALRQLSLTSPSSITLNDKVNLENINIQNYSNLNVINMSHCSNVVYEYILKCIKSNINNEALDVNITFGSGELSDSLSDKTIQYLSEIATLVKTKNLYSKVSVTGVGFNSNLSSLTDSNGDSCVSNITQVFTTLTLQDNDTSEFYLYNAEDNYILKEGGYIIITSTKQVDSWSYEVDGSPTNTLGGLISEDEGSSSKWQYKINAAKAFDNTSRTSTLVVKAKRGNDEIESTPISIVYIPISRITLIPDHIIASQITRINLSVNSDSTKGHILNEKYYTNPETGLSITYSSQNLNPNLSLSTDSNGMILGLDYTPQENQDDIISFNLNTIQGTTPIYYDKVAFTKNDLDTKPELNWAKVMLSGKLANLNESIKRSDLYDLGNMSINVTLENTNVGQDLTSLQYFNLTGSLILPNYPIKTITIPEGIVSFIWTNVANIESGEYLEYGQFIFPSTLQSAKVNLSFTGLPGNLQFDLSRTQINSIYNASSANTIQGVFDLSISTASGTSTSNTYLFGNGANTAYPKGLKQLGNYSNTIASVESAPAAMFSRNVEGASSDSYTFLYKLGYVASNDINIGYISSFIMSSSPIEWNNQAQYVGGLYYTFYKGSGAPTESTNFSRIQHIGDYAFGRNSLSATTVFKQIVINPNVKKIGYAAFMYFDGQLTTSDGLTQLNLGQLTDIGVYAFNMMPQSTEFNLINVKSYGERAFQLDTSKAFKHVINISGDQIPTNLHEYTFGSNQSTSLKNVVNISEENVYNKFNTVVGKYVTLNKV